MKTLEEVKAEVGFKALEGLIKYLQTKYYGKVGVYMGLVLSFREPIRIDAWHEKIAEVLTKAGGRKNYKGVIEVKNIIKITRIEEDIIGFPMIDFINEEDYTEELEEDILLVKRGIIEAVPADVNKGCIYKAVEFLAYVSKNFISYIDKSFIHLDLYFIEEEKSSTFYRNIQRILSKTMYIKDISMYMPSNNNIQLIFPPYVISIVNSIEEELFTSRAKHYINQIKEAIKDRL